MRRTVMTLVIILVSVLWLDSPATNRRVPARETPISAHALPTLKPIPCPLPRSEAGIPEAPAGSPPRARESPLSILISSATTAAAWGLPVAVFRQVRALFLNEG